MAIVSPLIKYFSNIPGWRTRRKIIVIESDDWGSIRMSSKEGFDNLLKAGIDLLSDEGFRYNKYDSLATGTDLTSLFDVLSSVKDKSGRSAVMTPVSIVANPDFSRIKQSGFTEYFYEPFTQTLKKHPGCENAFDLWKEGIEKRLFVPQFHGREHLNVLAWMRSLQKGHSVTLKAFDQGFWGMSTVNDPDIRLEYQAAFDFIDPADLKYHEEVIISGLSLFDQLFGYRATYFVPPNGPFSSKLERLCSDEGIITVSVPKLQLEPVGNGRTRKRVHWTGQNNRSKLVYLNRNCFFEPGLPGKDWVDSCLLEIGNAFKWMKPAVVSSHRVNFIGALYKENGEYGLSQLKLLLKRITSEWPDAEFLTTAELGYIIKNKSLSNDV